jgi:hypothetical protein
MYGQALIGVPLFLALTLYGYVVFFLILGHYRDWVSFSYPRPLRHLVPASWLRRFGLDDCRMSWRALFVLVVSLLLLAGEVTFVVFVFLHYTKAIFEVALLLGVIIVVFGTVSVLILPNVAAKLPDQGANEKPGETKGKTLRNFSLLCLFWVWIGVASFAGMAVIGITGHENDESAWIILTYCTLGAFLCPPLFGLPFFFQGVTFDESGVRVTLFGNEILSFSWADVLKIEEASRSIAVSYAVTLKNGKRISFDRRKKTRMAFERYRPDALVKKAPGSGPKA